MAIAIDSCIATAIINRVDWKKVVADVEESGLTQNEIAELVGCSQPYISQLKTGVRKKVDFDIGRSLEKLHKDRCGRRRQTKEARAA